MYGASSIASARLRLQVGDHAADVTLPASFLPERPEYNRALWAGLLPSTFSPTSCRRGPRRQLVGLNVEGNKPAHNALLYSGRSGRKEAGSGTSAAWSPTCKRNLALAMLDAPYIALGSTVWAEIYLNRELVWQRRMVRARVVERPFYAPQRRRATPPADF